MRPRAPHSYPNATPSYSRALVVLNPRARAAGAYESVRAELEVRFEVETVGIDVLDDAVDRALAAGVRVFLAAGGDGTVSALVNALASRTGGLSFRPRRPAIRPPGGLNVPLADLTLGAIGLGSSNDFHKPVRTRVAGRPARLDVAAATPRDVGRARYVGEDGVSRERLFLVSASLGLTAQANALFASLFRRLAWLDGAILASALLAIQRLQPLAASLALPDGRHELAITNLSLMKSPYLGGILRYDTPVEPADGLMAVNLCEGMGRLGALRTLVALARGRFLSLPGTRHWMAPWVSVSPDRPFDLELDGEVVRARSVKFDLLPERIRVCG